MGGHGHPAGGADPGPGERGRPCGDGGASGPRAAEGASGWSPRAAPKGRVTALGRAGAPRERRPGGGGPGPGARQASGAAAPLLAALIRLRPPEAGCGAMAALRPRLWPSPPAERSAMACHSTGLHTRPLSSFYLLLSCTFLMSGPSFGATRALLPFIVLSPPFLVSLKLLFKWLFNISLISLASSPRFSYPLCLEARPSAGVCTWMLFKKVTFSKLTLVLAM